MRFFAALALAGVASATLVARQTVPRTLFYADNH